MPTFKRGDVVRLKSGGPKMTVQGPAIDPEFVFCEWMDAQGRYQGAQFHPEMLKLIKN